MNQTVLTIELPELSDEMAVSIQNMLYSMMDTFDNQYCHQIERYYRMKRCRHCSSLNTDFSTPNNSEPPF